jgi:hypothetical protein
MVQSPKVRAFVDFLVERLNFDANYMEELCPIFQRQQEQARATAERAPAKKKRVPAAVPVVSEEGSEEDLALV